MNDPETMTDPETRKSRDTLMKKYDVPVHHLDFPYVETCTNGRELEKILHILQSGEEGYYPDLMKKTEERLAEIKPNSRYIRKTMPVVDKGTLDKEELTSLEEDLTSWLKDVSKNSEELDGVKRKTNPGDLPEVRTEKKLKEETEKTTKRIKSTDYSSWDKYDPDTEILKMDLEMEKLKKQAEETECRAHVKKERTVKFNEFATLAEAMFEADREREKGNECFKAGEYKQALVHYTNSINYSPSVNNYNNRAIAKMKLKKHKEAAQDCISALKYDPNNIKALVRLAQCREALKNFDEAVEIMEKVIQIDPNNTVAQNMVSKLTTVQRPATRMKIVEIDESKKIIPKSTPKIWEMPKNETKRSILKKQNVILPIPGPSTMPEPYYVTVENKDPEIIKRQEYILNHRPQMIYFTNPQSVYGDDDCMEIHIKKSDERKQLIQKFDRSTANCCKNDQCGDNGKQIRKMDSNCENEGNNMKDNTGEEMNAELKKNDKFLDVANNAESVETTKNVESLEADKKESLVSKNVESSEDKINAVSLEARKNEKSFEAKNDMKSLNANKSMNCSGVQKFLEAKKNVESSEVKKNVELLETKKNVEFLETKKNVEFLETKKNTEPLKAKMNVESLEAKNTEIDIAAPLLKSDNTDFMALKDVYTPGINSIEQFVQKKIELNSIKNIQSSKIEEEDLKNNITQDFNPTDEHMKVMNEVVENVKEDGINNEENGNFKVFKEKEENDTLINKQEGSSKEITIKDETFKMINNNSGLIKKEDRNCKINSKNSNLIYKNDRNAKITKDKGEYSSLNNDENENSKTINGEGNCSFNGKHGNFKMDLDGNTKHSTTSQEVILGNKKESFECTRPEDCDHKKELKGNLKCERFEEKENRVNFPNNKQTNKQLDKEDEKIESNKNFMNDNRNSNCLNREIEQLTSDEITQNNNKVYSEYGNVDLHSQKNMLFKSTQRNSTDCDENLNRQRKNNINQGNQIESDIVVLNQKLDTKLATKPDKFVTGSLFNHKREGNVKMDTKPDKTETFSECIKNVAESEGINKLTMKEITQSNNELYQPDQKNKNKPNNVTADRNTKDESNSVSNYQPNNILEDKNQYLEESNGNTKLTKANSRESHETDCDKLEINENSADWTTEGGCKRVTGGPECDTKIIDDASKSDVSQGIDISIRGNKGDFDQEEKVVEHVILHRLPEFNKKQVGESGDNDAGMIRRAGNLHANHNGGGGEPHVNRTEIQPDELLLPYGFLKMWRSVGRDETYTKQAEVLRNLNYNRLPEVLGYKLDGTMLSDIVSTMYLHFTVAQEVERVRTILENLTRVPRFGFVAMFLTGADKSRAQCIFEFLEQHGRPLSPNLKRLYNI